MKLRVAICDDHAEVLEVVKNMLEENGTPAAYDIAAFTNEQEFLAYLQKEQVDVAIVDIMLKGGASGIEVAKQINRDCPDTSVIFISGYTKFAEKLYDTKHLHFLKKPLTPQRLLPVLQKAMREDISKTVTIRQKNLFLTIDQDNIVMAESAGRKIKIYVFTEHGESVEHGATAGCGLEVVEHMAKLSEFEKLLSPDMFLRCHQSYIINMNHIAELNRKEAVLIHTRNLSNHDNCRSLVVPISRRYAHYVKEKTLRKIGGLL